MVVAGLCIPLGIQSAAAMMIDPVFPAIMNLFFQAPRCRQACSK